MTLVDPLAPLGRNEVCWCGSGVKYKRCHGNHRPGSQPGAPLPPDLEGSVFASPTVNVAGDAITVPERGVPFRIVETEPRGDFAHAKQTTDRLM